MTLLHAYSQTVADGTATSVVRPSDWNSGHNQFVTLSGNTAGASTISGTNIVYQGGNNVTLSAVTAAGAATIVISGATTASQTQQPMYFSASGTSTSANTLQFGDSNGISFSLSNGSVVGSVFTNYASASSNFVNTSQSSLFQQTSNIGTDSIYSAGFNGQSTTAIQGQSSLYLNYYQADDNIKFCRMDNMVSLNIAATTSFTTSGAAAGSTSVANANSFVLGRSYAFYGMGTGTNSTRIESLAGSTTASMGATRGYTYNFSISSNSVTHRVTNGFTIAAIANIDATGGVTYTTLGYSTSVSNSASSAASITTTTGTTSLANVSTSLHTGYRIFPVPWNSSLPNNQIWMGMLQTTGSTSSGTNSTVMSLAQYFNTNGVTSFAHITNTTANTASNWWPGQGVYSAATAAFPATIGFTQIAPNSMANIPAVFMNITL